MNTKKATYLKLMESKDEEKRMTNKKWYKTVKKKVKLAVMTSKSVAFKCLYEELEGKGRKKSYTNFPR